MCNWYIQVVTVDCQKVLPETIRPTNFRSYINLKTLSSLIDFDLYVSSPELLINIVIMLKSPSGQKVL